MGGAIFFWRQVHLRTFTGGIQIFFLYAQWVIMNALYGRLLLLRIFSVDNLIWTILVASVVKIVWRATVKERNKILGRFGVPSLPEKRIGRLRSDLIFLAMIMEFFATIFIPIIIYLYGIDNRPLDYILLSISLQLLAEFITCAICLYIDNKRGIMTLDHWDDRCNNHEGLVMIHIFVGVVYMSSFPLSFYVLEIKNKIYFDDEIIFVFRHMSWMALKSSSLLLNISISLLLSTGMPFLGRLPRLHLCSNSTAAFWTSLRKEG